MKSFASLLGAACLLGISSAQLLKYTPPSHSGLSYTFAEAPLNNTGHESDIFLQIQGPANASWIALGQGDQMKGSQMFIIYANAAGNNVTLSPRLASGHDEPKEERASSTSLLAGSGIQNGQMTANILCKDCYSWKGGSMNLTGAGQHWIWATKTGDPIKSDSQSASLQQHDDGAYASFDMDLSTMKLGNTANPFLDLGQANVTDVSAASSGYDGAAIQIHGFIMCAAFIGGFPLGAFLIRLASFRGLIWIHAGVQMLTYIGAILGLGLGVYIANKGAADISEFHPVFGIVIVVLLVFQPILGYVHHLQFKRHQGPNLYTHAHVWFGRVLVSAGLIDGLLGLLLAGKGAGVIAAYCVIAGLVWLLWIAVVMFAAKRQKGSRKTSNDIRMAALVDEDERDRGRYSGA